MATKEVLQAELSKYKLNKTKEDCYREAILTAEAVEAATKDIEKVLKKHGLTCKVGKPSAHIVSPNHFRLTITGTRDSFNRQDLLDYWNQWKN